MKKYFKNSILLLFLAIFCFSAWPSLALPVFPSQYFGTGEGWSYGTDEQWHLALTGKKSEFAFGEKVQLFAQVGPIDYAHQWQLKLYRDNIIFKEITNPWFYPDENFGWNYSNFVPYENNLPAGLYRAEFFLKTGTVFEHLAGLEFTVLAPENDYEFSHAVTALNWEHGVDNDYWNLKPINIQNAFAPGDRVYLMAQVRNIYQNHRWKTEFYRDNTLLWQHESPWLEVGTGWLYSNFYPYYSNAQPGNYRFKTYIDLGEGWNVLGESPFTVSGAVSNYEYSHTIVAPEFRYGTGSDYWNLEPVNAKTNYMPGEKIYALAQVRNIYVNHQWKVELFRDQTMLWDHQTDWLNVGGGWTYGNFFPYYENAQPGNYYFKIYLNTGSGFVLLDTKNFTVSGTAYDYVYLGSVTAAGWTHGTSSEYWNLEPIGQTSQFFAGDTVYLLSKLQNVYVDHRWRVELYKSGYRLWSHETGWLVVGSGWTYGSFYPYYQNAQPGTYEFRVYLDSGNGYELLDTKAFLVS